MAEPEVITHEIASRETDPRHPLFMGHLVPNNDPTLKTRGSGKGLALYDELKRDLRLLGLLEKRRMAVVTREWQVVPASDRPLDQRAAEVVREQLLDMPFDDACLALLDAILKGFAVGEVMWEVVGGAVVAREIRPRPQYRFVFDTVEGLRLLTHGGPVDGVAVPDRKFIVHRQPADDGSPYGHALGSSSFWPVLFKKTALSAWIGYLEKFAQPTPIGEYPVNANPDEQAKLLSLVSALATNRGVIVPQGTIIRLLEAQRAGGSDAYERFVRYEDEELTVAWMGETLSTSIGETGGALAASQTHDGVRKEKAKLDADRLCRTLNSTLIQWITEYNVPGATPPKVWRIFDTPADLSQLSERDKRIYEMGFNPTPEYIHETYGGEWTQRETTPPTSPAQSTPAPAQAAPNRPQFSEEEPDPADQVSEQLRNRAQSEMTAMIAPIRQLVMSAGSLEEIRDRLLDSYGEMAPNALGKLMEMALGVAHLAGRHEVSDGI